MSEVIKEKSYEIHFSGKESFSIIISSSSHMHANKVQQKSAKKVLKQFLLKKKNTKQKRNVPFFNWKNRS